MQLLIKNSGRVLAAATVGVMTAAATAAAADLYQNDKSHWLYIGWENDQTKAFTFMAGAVAPTRGSVIQYAVDVNGTSHVPDESAADRKTKIKWYLSEGYLPSPVSEWDAGKVHVRIQHFANRVLNDSATVLYSRVTLTNTTTAVADVCLRINAGATVEIPLTSPPTSGSADSMSYQIPLAGRASKVMDFAALVAGGATAPQIVGAGTFDANHTAMRSYYSKRIQGLTYPVSLPSTDMVYLYKNAMITLWETVVQKSQTDYEMHGSGGNPGGFYSYDRTFNHDLPDIAEELMREGDYELAKKLVAGTWYNANSGIPNLDNQNIDTVPKFIVPYAEYLQKSGDSAFFTPAVRAKLRDQALLIHKYRYLDASDPAHHGIMKASNTLDNDHGQGVEFQLVDDFAALHGLTAYWDLCKRLGDKAEAEWALAEMRDLNLAVNNALTQTLTRRKVDWYMDNLDDKGIFYSGGKPGGNWLGTALMMSSFPWVAQLRGFDLGGEWKDHFDSSVKKSMDLRDATAFSWGKIPDGSWGAWNGVEYGASYNVGMGMPCLSSEAWRLEPIKNLRWLLANQSAPMQWGENFSQGDWSKPGSDYESWGLSFIKAGLQLLCVSVRADGLVIIGRGVPDDWTQPGQTISWANVLVNNGKKIGFSITGGNESTTLSITGDTPENNIVFNLPRFRNNIKSATAGAINNSLGTVTLPPATRKVTVYFRTMDQGRALERSKEDAPSSGNGK